MEEDRLPWRKLTLPVQNVSATGSSLHRAYGLASTKYVSEELTVSSRPDLSSAGRVVSGGRALKSLENFNKVLDPLADVLGAGTSSQIHLDKFTLTHAYQQPSALLEQQ